mgnify:CR=1 FL=1
MASSTVSTTSGWQDREGRADTLTSTPAVERLAVIGDLHAEHEHLAVVLRHLEHLEEPVDAIICTGDIADGGGSVDVCCELLARFGVITVRGNHDRWLLEDRVRHLPMAHRLKALSRTAIDYLESLAGIEDIETIAGRVMLCHGVGENDLAKVWPGSERMPPERSRRLDGMIDSSNYRYLFNGHMHYRTVVAFPGLTLINAGTLRRDHRPGFSVIDFRDRQITAYAVNSRRVQPLLQVPLENGDERRVWTNTQAFDGDWTPLTLY